MNNLEAGVALYESGKKYADDVINNRIPTCKYVKQAVERNFDDLKNAGKRGYYFDPQKAILTLTFFTYLKHSTGRWRGQPVILEPWQSFIISCVFGWLRCDTHTRRFTTVYEEITRKNGKTLKLAGVGLFGLVADNEGAPEIYSAATKRDQAKILFTAARRMVLQCKQLVIRVVTNKHDMEQPSNDGVFIPLSNDANSLDGLNPHYALIDEFHAHKTSDLWEVLISALGSRLQPLIWAITTAGFYKNRICYSIRDYAIKVLAGALDDSLFAIIYTTDEGDDIYDPTTWKKANPNLGISVTEHYLQNMASQAKIMPSQMNNFLTKHLNVWTNSELLWMNMEEWKACRKSFNFEELKTANSIYCGLDLASTSDICSLYLAAEMPDGSLKTFGRNYLPENAVKERTKKANVPYDKWVSSGFIQTTPGNVTDYNFIKKDIKDLLDQLPIKEIAFDRWNSSQLVNDLMNDGAPMVSFGQGYLSMNPAMKEFERLVLSRQIEHNNDPVLTWAISNLVAKVDEAGNIKPAKNKSVEKIDPAVALIMAVGRAMVQEVDEEPEPGIVIL